MDRRTTSVPEGGKSGGWGGGRGDRYMDLPLRPLVGFCDIIGIKGLWEGGEGTDEI
jgi:hypothetical protein